MTFTATGEPANEPPRVKLDLDTSVSGATFNEITVLRDGTAIRLQPPSGAQTSTTYDYEMPFGVAVEYAATGTYLPFVAPEFTESWASLASWTQDPGSSWSVSGGEASSTTEGASLTRTTTSPIQRVTVDDPQSLGLLLASADFEDVVSVTSLPDSTTLYATGGSGDVATTGTGSYTVSIVDNVVTVTGDDGWTLQIDAFSGVGLTTVILLSGGGQFAATGTSFSSVSDPDRIVVAASGNIYTLDIAGKLVRKFSSAGAALASWSTTGVPNDIGVDSSENVYVTDQTSNLVRKYNSSGVAGITWSTTGVPVGIGVDNSNGIYVLDRTANTIRKYSDTGAGITSWSNVEAVNHSGGKALDVLPGGSTVYTVVEGGGETTIQRFSNTGTLLGYHFIADLISNPSVRVDSGGNYWVRGSNYLNGATKYDATAPDGTASEIGSMSISPHTVGGLAFVGSTLLVGDKTDDTVRSFATTTASVGELAVTPSVDPEEFYESATITVAGTEAWLIHPSQPSLSVSIDAGPNAWRDDGLNVDISTARQTASAASVTLHQPVGRERTVAITQGVRRLDDWTLVLIAPTLDDRDELQAVLRDQTPLLLRSPEAFGWDLPDGFYSVQDVSFDRIAGSLADELRRVTLPLIPTDAPVARVATERTYTTLATEFGSYAEIPSAYDTYAELLLGAP